MHSIQKLELQVGNPYFQLQSVVHLENQANQMDVFLALILKFLKPRQVDAQYLPFVTY